MPVRSPRLGRPISGPAPASTPWFRSPQGVWNHQNIRSTTVAHVQGGGRDDRLVWWRRLRSYSARCAPVMRVPRRPSGRREGRHPSGAGQESRPGAHGPLLLSLVRTWAGAAGRASLLPPPPDPIGSCGRGGRSARAGQPGWGTCAVPGWAAAGRAWPGAAPAGGAPARGPAGLPARADARGASLPRRQPRRLPRGAPVRPMALTTLGPPPLRQGV